MKSTHSHGTVSLLLFFFFLFLSLSPAAAQPSPNPDNMHARSEVPLAVPITIFITGLFVCFFFIYIRGCFHVSALSLFVTGLDASAIEALPTFSYSDHKIGKGALECAVCLNEFEDRETLRLLPKCDHFFHPGCIDAWLASHTTCPVCRANLAQQTGPDPVQSEETGHPVEAREQSDQSRDDEIVIQVDEDDHPLPSDRNTEPASKVAVDSEAEGARV